jgi:hypothetical protein
VKIAFLALAVGAAVQYIDAADFARASAFDSVDAFVATATSFQPVDGKSDLSPLFTVRELGQPEDPKTGTRVTATSIQSAVALWTDDFHALVFVTALPPTEATPSAVGVLFLLKHTNGSWRIEDHQRFVATGKEAEVSAQLTAGTGSGYHLGSDGMRPVVTVKESQGGRGYAYQTSASYTLRASKLKRLNLE